MESNCNNQNSMSCAHGHMHGYTGQMSGCSQVMQNREHMAQQNRGCMVQRQRCGDCIDHNRRGECQQYRKEECVQHSRKCNDEIVKQSGVQNRTCTGNVSVECVCQVTCDKDCHRHDEMEHLGCEFPVVMAYVPWQQWGDLYEAECGLQQGTIFKDLNYIFCGERC